MKETAKVCSANNITLDSYTTFNTNTFESLVYKNNNTNDLWNDRNVTMKEDIITHAMKEQRNYKKCKMSLKEIIWK